jgi:hypothetical protein
MALQDELIAIDTGFWTGGEDHFLAHLDESCMLVFAQMRGLYSRAQVAASARDPKRWRDLRITAAALHQPSPDLAFLSYDARAERGTGGAYHALIGSAYVRRETGWKLTFHQHSTLGSDAEAQAGTP